VRTSDTHVHTRLLDLRQIWESVESRNIFLFLMVTAPVLCCCGPATACRMCRMYSYVFETLTWYIHTSTLIFGVGVLLSLADQSVVRVCRVVLRHLDEFSRSVSPFVLSFCITCRDLVFHVFAVVFCVMGYIDLFSLVSRSLFSSRSPCCDHGDAHVPPSSESRSLTLSVICYPALALVAS
jgi:hypothetical protein